MTDRDLSTGVDEHELAADTMIVGKHGDDLVLLVRDGDDVHAIGATCTHYGGPLVDGLAIKGTVRCPWHHACFDLRTGAVLHGPALASQPTWRVEKRDGRLFVGERRVPAEPRRVETNVGVVVIVGAGPAGVSVASWLRREGYAGRVILLSGEADLPYDKPNLSKDYLAGHAPAEWLPLYPQTHYGEQRIELRLGATVAALDLGAKQIVLSSGERLAYGALVLATGASPRKLSIDGGDAIEYFRTRQDAERIVSRIPSIRNAVVIGSSFIGLEVAASLRQKDVSVSVISPDSIPLARVLGEAVGNRVRAIHEQHGVTFHLGRKPSRVEGDAVVLDDGTRVPADLVIAGVGVTPSDGIARAAGLEVDNGVIVDESLRTAAPDVYACGDVARWPDSRTHEPTRIEHWVVAGRQGQTVARNILGKREPFAAVPFFWSAHYDVTITYIGHASHFDAVEIDGSLEANDATVAYREGSRIVAVATIGRDRVSLAAEEAMERGDFEALCRLVTRP